MKKNLMVEVGNMKEHQMRIIFYAKNIYTENYYVKLIQVPYFLQKLEHNFHILALFLIIQIKPR